MAQVGCYPDLRIYFVPVNDYLKCSNSVCFIAVVLAWPHIISSARLPDVSARQLRFLDIEKFPFPSLVGRGNINGKREICVKCSLAEIIPAMRGPTCKKGSENSSINRELSYSKEKKIAKNEFKAVRLDLRKPESISSHNTDKWLRNRKVET